jgi:hypothetical protein
VFENEIMINASMLPQAGTAALPSPYGTVAAQFTPELNVGDTLLVLTEDVQTFYVMCKVVSQ